MASIASAERSIETARSNDVGSEMIIWGTDGLEYYNKSPLSRIFLPKKNVAPVGCISGGEFCVFDPIVDVCILLVCASALVAK